MQQLPKFEQHPDIAPRPSVYFADLEAFKATLPPDSPYCLPADNPDLLDPAKHPDFRWKTYYSHDYAAIFRDMAAKPQGEPRERFARSAIRELIKKDLFFIVFFVMQIPRANVPFVVELCNEIEASTPDGGMSQTLTFHNYAREHFKSTVITVGLTIKRIVNDPDCTTAIFSFKKPAADAFLFSIRETLQKELMYQCFPDILYEKPDTESPSWSLQHGIVVKRKSASRKEKTVEAFGLIEGMPTGGHFDHRVYDDVETFDIAKSPDQLNLCFQAFEMSDNLGTDGGTELIIGTYYSHIGALVRIRDKQDIHGKKMYKTVVKPATHDGTRNGRPVLLSQERLDKLKASKHFDAQQLCNPTPSEATKLDSKMLKMIEPQFMPRDRYKFLIIDQAGGSDTRVKKNRKGDNWFIGIVSVRPELDDRGASDCYLENFVADEMTHAEAINTIIDMYLQGGFIRAIGVEKVGLATTEIHVKDALKLRGRRVSTETNTLILLRPAGRSTEERVEAALQWPLCNGKLYVSTAVPEEQRQKLITELDLFPFYHPDIINGWAYAYDIIKTYKFDTASKAKPVSVTAMMAARGSVRGDLY